MPEGRRIDLPARLPFGSVPAPSIVTLQRVAKRYGWRGAWVVRDVDLELSAGSLTVLSGVNGSGKTTLLRIIAGVSRPTHGIARGARRVAVVPDRFVLPPRMTARSYLRHHGRLRGLATTEADRRAEELGERLGVRPGLDVALQTLSKGNAQKVALAQAFLAPVDLLALDEPRTAIDTQAVAALDGLLEAARRRGAAVVVSEPASDAAYAGARRHQLAAGRLRPLGELEPSPAEWATTPPQEAGAGEAPPAGLVTIRLRTAAARPSGTPERLPPNGFAGLAETWSCDGEGAVTATVDPGRSDELLRRALAAGWSVLDVHRASGGGRPATSGG